MENKNLIYIESADIPELDFYVGIREVHLLRFFEPEPGIFIAESKNVIDIALQQGYEPINIVTTEKMINDPILDRVGNAPIYVVEAKEANRRFGYVLTGDISCAMRRKDRVDYREIIKGAERIVVLEDVENPTNLGAIFRSAAALGMDAVLLSPSCVDPLYRRAMRVSVGTTMLIPWAYVGQKEKEWREYGIQWLKKEGFTTVAMALRKDNINIDDPLLKKEKKIAIIMGNEGNGLKTETIINSDYVAKIPMMNDVDSLNVAVASGLAMWELRKS